MRKILSVSAVTLVSALLISPAFAAKTDTCDCEGQKIKVSFPDSKTAVMVYSDEIIVLQEACC